MPKTTIKVRTKRWELFNRECKAASMRRDDFLDRTLPGEILMLQGIPACDAEGERWLKKTWVDHGSNSDTELHPVPILLSDTVIAQLNAACIEKRVPRDAFIDCALNFLIERIYESVVVIKNPRTTKDLVSRIANVLNDPRDEIEEQDRQGHITETLNEWSVSRNLASFSDDFYKIRLSFNAARVDQEKNMFEAFNLLLSDDTETSKPKLDHDDLSPRGT